MVSFTWGGFDEMDEVTGDGSAELFNDRSIAITSACHNGDEAILKATRDTSSTACWRRATCGLRWPTMASLLDGPIRVMYGPRGDGELLLLAQTERTARKVNGTRDDAKGDVFDYIHACTTRGADTRHRAFRASWIRQQAKLA